MSLADFERFVFDAMFLNDDDPVARWGELRALQARLIERLAVADEVRIVGPGTDLRMSVKGRVWENSDGRKNMPSGEVFTGPHEASAEGVVSFDLPSSVGGVVVRGVRLRFEAGKVVEASASEGEDMLLAQLDADAGARYLGELGIGTNFRIGRPILNTLYDEKIGGTVHLALGSSYPATGGTNVSAIHWDLITDLRQGGEVLLDGEPSSGTGASCSDAGAAPRRGPRDLNRCAQLRREGACDILRRTIEMGAGGEGEARMAVCQRLRSRGVRRRRSRQGRRRLSRSFVPFVGRCVAHPRERRERCFGRRAEGGGMPDEPGS
jgi:hypothetical protein